MPAKIERPGGEKQEGRQDESSEAQRPKSANIETRHLDSCVTHRLLGFDWIEMFRFRIDLGVLPPRN